MNVSSSCRWCVTYFIYDIVNWKTDLVRNIDIKSSKENNNSPSSQIVHPSAFFFEFLSKKNIFCEKVKCEDLCMKKSVRVFT